MKLVTVWDIMQKNNEIVENIKSQYDITNNKELILLLMSLFYQSVTENSWLFSPENLETYKKKDVDDMVIKAKSEMLIYLILIGQFFNLSYSEIFATPPKQRKEFDLDLCIYINSYIKNKTLPLYHSEGIKNFIQNAIYDLKGDNFTADFIGDCEKILYEKGYMSK